MSQYILKRKAIDAVYTGIKLYHDEHHPLMTVYDYIIDVISEIEAENVVPKSLYEEIVWKNAVMSDQLMLVGLNFGEKPKDMRRELHAYWDGIEGDGYAEDENGEMQIVYDVFECSNCGCEHYADESPEWAFCPRCGARMDLQPPM